jgi:hypothetical protein
VFPLLRQLNGHLVVVHVVIAIVVDAVPRRSADGHKPDLFDLVDYVESTGSTKLCLVDHLFHRSFFPTVASKNDTLNGECLRNMPSLRFEPDPMNANAMFFDD